MEELSPRRKRRQSTSTYIYETLFKGGANSDVTIVALEHEWSLHKLYLRQSGYFASMFSGNWKESEDSVITLDIPDPNITRESLDTAFSSLYRDDIELSEVDICPLLATSSMLQLEGLKEHCLDFMTETLKSSCVVHYVNSASLYGYSDIAEHCKEWLRLHMVKTTDIALLRETSAELFAETISSPDLYALQVEMDVYTQAKRWLFLTLNAEWSGDFDKVLAAAEEYFRRKGGEDGYLLESAEGEPYTEVFRAIRLEAVIVDGASATTVERDKIIPQSWLCRVYRQQWLTMLQVDHRLDPGPAELTPEEFLAGSMRCGRVLMEPGEYCWRWSGFSFGFDLLTTCDPNTGVVAVKRNCRCHPCVSAIGMQQKRVVMIRLRVTSLDVGGRARTLQDTGIQTLSLSPDESHHLLAVNHDATFPLYISVNMALTSLRDFSL